MNRLTKRIRGYVHGAEGTSKETLTGNYCRGCFESTACVEKLAEYEDLEEQGKLLKLPCAVGDTVYTAGYGVGHVLEWKIISCEIYEDEIVFIDDSETEWRSTDFGKTVFITKSAAEQALKEMEGKK